MGMRSTSASCFFAVAAVAVALALVVLGTGLGAEAAVHMVGDSAGWTIIGNVSYSAWAASKAPFKKGDTLVFVYNSQFHNVLEVTKAAYKACDGSSPLAAYSTGNDTVTIKHMGHTFFLCGFPGHCQIGQKLDVRVPKTTSAAALAPSRAPAVASPTATAGGPATVAGDNGGAIGVVPAVATSHANRDVVQISGFVITSWAITSSLLFANALHHY